MRSTILADDHEEQPPTGTLSDALATSHEPDERLTRHLPTALRVLFMFLTIVFALDGVLTCLAPR